MMVVMVMGLSSHIHNGRRHRQYRGVFVFNELTDILRQDVNKQKQKNCKKEFHFYLHSDTGNETHAEAKVFDSVSIIRFFDTPVV